MSAFLARSRSALSLLLVLVWMGIPCALWLYLLILPLARLLPSRRAALVSLYMNGVSGGILACLRLGGARFARTGRLPTETPILVLANHQSLIDILTATLMATRDVPRFVTRLRYARFVPLVSTCVRLLGCPVIDPRPDPKRAAETIERVTRAQEGSVLLFPEGHRSRDGEVRPFKVAGTQAALRGRHMPVYAVVNDGVWTSRRLVDFVVNIHRLRGASEVMGPFEPPEGDVDVAALVERMRNLIVQRLGELRARDARV